MFVVSIVVQVIVALLLLDGSSTEETCETRYLDDPIAAKHGDFVIGGLFQIGKLTDPSETSSEHCSCLLYTSPSPRD